MLSSRSQKIKQEIITKKTIDLPRTNNNNNLNTNKMAAQKRVDQKGLRAGLPTEQNQQ
jgi:hypothetical protein